MTKQVGHYFITIGCEECFHHKQVPVYCGNRFCPVCSNSRRFRCRDRLKFILEKVQIVGARTVKHLTLTIRNESDLPKMLKHLLASFRRLRQRAFWRNNVDGGAFVIEVTGRPGCWHAHIHAVLICYYMKQQHLVKLWKACSGSIGVYITALPKKDIVRYLTKYLTKQDEPDLVWKEKGRALKGFRLFQPFGSWFHVSSSWKKPKCVCPECSCPSLFPWDIILAQPLRHHWKDVDIKIPVQNLAVPAFSGKEFEDCSPVFNPTGDNNFSSPAVN